MARTVTQAFDEYIGRLNPLEADRQALLKHRDEVEFALRRSIEISRFVEIGSFHQRTGIRRHCTADMLACIKSPQPGSPDTALGWVRNALVASFPGTRVRINRPAVVIEFANGAETWKVIPAFVSGRGDDDSARVYDIPAPTAGWMGTAPEAHAAYLEEINSIEKVWGGAKKLARLAKAWKFFNEVPISSFYLEMRAAEYMSGEQTHIPIWDICGLLQRLDRMKLEPMKDPRTIAGQFDPCPTPELRDAAVSKLRRGANRARKAAEAFRNEDMEEVFYYLDQLFGGTFPSRY